MKLFTNNFSFCGYSRKMEWTTEHEIFFSSKVIAFRLHQYKPTSKERGQRLNRIEKVTIILRNLGSKLVTDR